MKEKYIKSPINYSGGKYRLLKYIIPYFPKEIDVFVDLFGGAGTTCVVAKELERKYLGCDIGDKAIHIAESRIKSA